MYTGCVVKVSYVAKDCGMLNVCVACLGRGVRVAC